MSEFSLLGEFSLYDHYAPILHIKNIFLPLITQLVTSPSKLNDLF